MKTLAVLFAGEMTGHALESLSGSGSAFSRAFSSMAGMRDVSRVLVFSSDTWHNGAHNALPALSTALAALPPAPGGVSVGVCTAPSWTASSFFSRVSAESEGFDHVFLAWGDCPFLDSAFTARLFAEKHLRYAAEYTFADGYPYGLAPDILARGILPVLANMAKDNDGPVTRSLVFDTIKKDINSFDIETDIAPTDLRHLRLELACAAKRDALLCLALDGIDASNYAETVRSRLTRLRTLPAFYAVQVAARCPFECTYCPYPSFCRSGKGSSPGVSATERTDCMKKEDFSALVGKIADFSEDAVVSLSLWGECAFHPDIAELVQTVLARPGLSLLIETTGIGWDPRALDSIAHAAASAAPRLNRQNPVNWILSLDAVGSACYGQAHGIPVGAEPSVSADARLREALSFAESLIGRFPGAVWPQMVRLAESEMELEPFYRFWKQKYGQVIIQKHDHFCRSIADRRVADLSPLVRHPCWHLKRDMCILMDGAVPLCREDLYAAHRYGNALSGDLAEIWAGAGPVHEQHCVNNHEGMCGACDEYYTYNF